MTRAVARAFAVGLGVLASVGPANAEPAVVAGFVFEDRDGDGVRGEGEPSLPGVQLHHRGILVRSDAEGRFAFEVEGESSAEAPPDRADFVVATLPAGFDARRWYAEPGPEIAFGLHRVEPLGARFVFAQITDAHLADRPAEVGEYGIPGAIRMMPSWLSGFAMWGAIRVQGADADEERIVPSVSAELARRHGEAAVEGKGRNALLGMWVRDIVNEPESAVDALGDFRGAMRELAAIAPAFVVATGDNVLESNEASPEAIARWMDVYLRETRASGLRFFHTIGNNEIAGSESDAFAPGDTGYGKALYREKFGPTYYAFERGDFHFVALDTHRQLTPGTDEWSASEMDDEVDAWVRADLAANPDRRVVVLNHEPFRADPRWAIPSRFVPEVEVQDWLHEHAVPYTLTGHLHTNGTTVEQNTRHVMTGSLSGLRWTLPHAAYPRGYRLVQAAGGELYSVWKPLGEPVLGFVEPERAQHRTLHATGPASGARAGRVLVAAADANGPVASLTLRAGDEAIPLERWSAYFHSAMLSPEQLARPLVVEAELASGETLRREHREEED